MELNILRCDVCNKETYHDNDDNWWKLWVRQYPPNSPLDMHFCSTGCLARFAIVKRDQEEE